METPPPPPPPPASTRRVPPPCWTRDETVALIQAYRGKWFALGRGNLRAADWDAVADAVSPSAVLGTPKTAVQCRHKIEKMRKRFRAEKQRGLRRPGKFFSSWDLFPLLDAMNFASVGSGDHHDPDDSDDVKVTAVDGLRLKLANNGKLDRDYGLNLGFQDDFRAGYGSKYGFVDGDVEFNRKLGDGYDVKLSGNRNFVAQLANYGSNCKIGDSYTCAVDFGHSVAPGVGAVTGFPVKSLVDRSFLSSGFKSKNSFRTDEKFKTGFTSYVLPGGKTKDCNKLNEESRTDIDLGYNEEGDRVNAGGGSLRIVSADSNAARYGLHDAENYSGADEGFVGNGYASSSRFYASKKSGVKRGSDVVGEMVMSIKFLSEVFVRMEKTKMEMVREIEKMRMEMEMKHNQMILDSQQQIVDSFAKALLETKKSKKKMKLLSPRANEDGDEE